MDDVEQSDSTLVGFLKGSSILVLSNLCLKAINFFLLPLYTGYLTPSMLGVSDSITTLTGFLLPLLTLGLDSAYSAFYFEKADPHRAKKVFNTLLVAFGVLGLIPVASLPASEAVAQVLFGGTEFAPIVRVAFAGLCMNLWYMPFALELRLRNDMFKFGLSNVIASLLMVALNVLFVSVLQLGEMSLILSTMIVNVEQLVFLSVMVRQKPQKQYIDGKLFKQMMIFALPLIPMAVMNWVLALSDRYILLYFQGADVVGMYGIGLRFTTVLNVVVSGVSMAYTTFAFSSREDEGAKRQYKYIFQIESVLLLAAAFTIALFGKEIIGIMTEASYAESYKPLRDLMFAQAVYAMTTVVGYGIFFEKKSGYSLLAVTVGAVVNLVLNLLLVPQFGMQAAAFTTLIGYMVHFAITYYYSQKFYPCDYGLLRAVCTAALLYFIALFTGEFALGVKLVIWVAAAVVVVVMNLSTLKLVLGYLSTLIRGKRN